MPSTSKTKAPFKYSNLSKALKPRTFQRRRRQGFFPTFGVGLLDFKFNSSPRPELFSSPGLLLETPWTAQVQKFKTPRIAQPETPGVPNPRVSLECPEFPEIPSPRLFSVSLECPTPESFRVHSFPQSLPGVPNPRDSLQCPESLEWSRVFLECPV